MRLITQCTDYAVRALCYISSQNGKVVSTQKLSKELDISWALLRRILQELTRRGLVSSYRGKQGGFILAIPANKILLMDIIRIFQGFIQWNICETKRRTCPNLMDCLLRKKIRGIEEYVKKELGSVTLQSLLYT